jgi:glycosidase
MIYGKNISGTRPVIDYPGVELKETVQVENPDYLFLNLTISPETKPGTMHILFKKGKKTVIDYSYILNAREKNPSLHKGFDNSDVIYLIMPDRFANGDTTNDNMPGMLEKANRNDPNGRHGGDIKGIADHLDYLKNFGVTAIWSTPLMENNMPAYSYHGYAMTDFYKIDPRFGTNEDYKNLVKLAHKKGLKIIQDMVFNHCGTNYFWKDNLPMSDWYNRWDKFTRSNYHAGVVTDPHASEYDFKRMVAGWFDTSMADLNQNNPYVANYLIQNSIWWIEYAGIDGIRQDTYPYPYKEFMSKWMKRILEEYPDFNVVGESWLSYPSAVAYWLENNHNTDGYHSHLTNVFDFPLMYAIIKAFNEPNGWATGAAQLYEVVSQDFVYSDPMKLVVFGDNHDIDRLFYNLHNNFGSWKMAMTLILTTRGIPLIYYGTEILMDGNKGKSDGNIREDFPGGWPGDKVNAFMSKGRTQQQNEAYNFLTRLLHWRQNNKAVQFGSLTHYIVENGVYVYFRKYKDENVMVILNNNDEKTDLDMSRFESDLNGYSKAKSVLTRRYYEKLDKITLPAKSPLILELEK